MSIRIAQIIGKMWAGGVEAVVFNYYRAVDHEKYQFDFFYDEDSTVEPPQDLIELGARFYKLPPYQQLPKYIKALREYLRKGNYQIVHSHLNTISVFPLYCAWKEGVPYRIAHNHSIPGGKEAGRNTLKNILKRFSKTFANEYCACSEAAARWLFGNLIVDEGRVTILKNAVDFEKFRISKAVANQKRMELNIPENVFVLGHVGRFTAAKNHKKVLSVFNALKTMNPDAVLILVGDGEEHDNIENWLDQYKVRGSVIITGKVKDPQNYYPLMDVLILPSVFEGVPVTIVEAQIAGIPCVISDIVNPDVVISNACDYLSVSSSDEMWAEKIIAASKKTVSLNEHSNDYDITQAVKTLEAKYDGLLKR